MPANENEVHRSTLVWVSRTETPAIPGVAVPAGIGLGQRWTVDAEDEAEAAQ